MLKNTFSIINLKASINHYMKMNVQKLLWLKIIVFA